jgi:hypothetical protein
MKKTLVENDSCRTMAEKPHVPYGAGNSFPKEATNTDDWLDAIGLVRSAPFPSQNPIQNTSVVCAYRQSNCKTALAGMSLDDVANMTESERIEKVPINGQRKRLVAFHEHTHTRLRGLRLICGRSRLRR